MKADSSYIQHFLNKSPTKQTHTFSKSCRFKYKKRLQTEAIYNLPSTKKEISCSCGIGGRKDLSSGKQILPAPYQMKNMWIKKNGIPSFGKGREDVSFGNLFLFKKEKQPQPATYSPNYFGSKRNGVSLHKKIRSSFDGKSNGVPGPQQYSVDSLTIRNSGKYIISSYQNKAVPKMVESTDKTRKKSNISVPGPGAYDKLNPELGQGSKISKYKNSLGKVISKEHSNSRKNKEKLKTPKCKYRLFSEFSGFSDE